MYDYISGTHWKSSSLAHARRWRFNKYMNIENNLCMKGKQCDNHTRTSAMLITLNESIRKMYKVVIWILRIVWQIKWNFFLTNDTTRYLFAFWLRHLANLEFIVHWGCPSCSVLRISKKTIHFLGSFGIKITHVKFNLLS